MGLNFDILYARLLLTIIFSQYIPKSVTTAWEVKLLQCETGVLYCMAISYIFISIFIGFQIYINWYVINCIPFQVALYQVSLEAIRHPRRAHLQSNMAISYLMVSCFKRDLKWDLFLMFSALFCCLLSLCTQVLFSCFCYSQH